MYYQHRSGLSGSSTTIRFLLCIVILVISCRKNDLAVKPSPGSNQAVNQWILDSMLYYYYDSKNINQTTTIDDEPRAFYKKLLSPTDRFSVINEGNKFHGSSSSFSEYGFHYSIFSHPTYSSSLLLGLINFVAKQSSSENAGISRGMYFNRVNGIPIQQDNLEEISSILNSGKPLDLSMIVYEEEKWKDFGHKKLLAAFFEERPVYTTRVFEKDNIKTGYLFYNAFNEFFDADIITAFQDIKNENVQELILDLRYNGGGSVASAAKLCAMAANVTPTDVFGIFKGNERLKTSSQSFIKIISASSNNSGKNFMQLVSARLSLSRIFILTSAATASAAELTINNLKPYLQVIQIGDKTLGKDKATLIIRDIRNPAEINWTLQPVIFTLFNAKNEGDYANGLRPDITIREYERLPLVALNNPQDALIGEALKKIYGTIDVFMTIINGSIKPKAKSLHLDNANIKYNSSAIYNQNRELSTELP